MPDPLTAESDIPPPRGHRITVPDDAAATILDLHRVRQLHIAAFLTHAAKLLRRHPHAPMDGCLNRGNCNPDLRLPGAQVNPCCLLCALDAAVLRMLPNDAATAVELVQSGTLAKQLAIDTIDANPHRGGDVFVLEHLAALIHTERLADTLTPGETA